MKSRRENGNGKKWSNKIRKKNILKLRINIKDFIVLIKSGSFWNVFYSDAFLIHIIMGYSVKNNRVGFPSKVLSKVLNKVSALNINYILVYELDNIVKYEYLSNLYNIYLYNYRKYIELKRYS